MRLSFVWSAVCLSAVLVLCSAVAGAQNAQPSDQNRTRNNGFGPSLSDLQPNDPGGPAPTRDLNGTWIGSGEAELTTHIPPLTPAGQAKLELNIPDPFSGSSNDPWQTCDTFGMPRVVNNENRTIGFATMPDRIIILENYGKNWREVWMDGRQLPKNVGHPGGPSSRWFGYSVGHWEGDHTLVVDTVGTMAESWVDRRGYPHTADLHVTERYDRPDHNHVNMSETIDDPAYYTKSFVIAITPYKWIQNQDKPSVAEIPFADEQVCVPSAALEYMKLVGDPANEDSANSGKKPAK